MAKVHVCNVLVYENPSAFLKPFQFEITFECIEDLKEDLEWKIIYVGSAESEQYDQVNVFNICLHSYLWYNFLMQSIVLFFN